MNTLKELVEALRGLDAGAADYIEEQFTVADFMSGAGDHCGVRAFGVRAFGPLDFFAWVEHPFRRFDEWRALNKSLKDIEREKTINLDDYTTKDIDFTGCNPVVAEALKRGLSIECKAGSPYNCKCVITGYLAGNSYPYVSKNVLYPNVTPIKKKKSEVQIRVKGPVEVMQWLADNGYFPDKEGDFVTNGGYIVFWARLWGCCGKAAPEGWKFPELLEKVAVIND
jgi:hypothetical protein